MAWSVGSYGMVVKGSCLALTLLLSDINCQFDINRQLVASNHSSKTLKHFVYVNDSCLFTF